MVRVRVGVECGATCRCTASKVVLELRVPLSSLLPCKTWPHSEERRTLSREQSVGSCTSAKLPSAGHSRSQPLEMLLIINTYSDRHMQWGEATPNDPSFGHWKQSVHPF